MTPVSKVASFSADTDPPVRGHWHVPEHHLGDAVVLTHGAGSNCDAPLLVRLAEALCRAGFAVLRCDLPYRQQRRWGPPMPASCAHDRAGLRNAVWAVTEQGNRRVFLGGHSYGGRQASVLAAEEPALVGGLLLTSYPLHPPRRPAELRTSHFSRLRTPVVFVHGTLDPFASSEELKAALQLISAPWAVVSVPGAGHDLQFAAKTHKMQQTTRDPLWIREAVEAFQRLIS